MHSLLEGVVKSMFSKWFGQENNQMSCSLRNYMQQIDQRVINIRPPKYIPTTPRSIYCWKTWRAHEYLSFILYYALPVFVDIMEAEQFEHLIKLVKFLEIILSREILKENLIVAEEFIIAFVKDFSVIYSDTSMLSGVHELLHLVECTRNFGPLNNINCFPFEELNRKCLGSIHGRDLIGEEFIKLFSIIQSLGAAVTDLNVNSRYVDFVKKEMKFKTSNRKRIYQESNRNVVKILSKQEVIEEKEIIEAINKQFGIEAETFFGFSKIDLNGITYSSSKNKSTKNCDSCFSTKKGYFGNINCFFKYNEKIFVVGKQIIRLYNPFYWEKFTDFKCLIDYCYINNNNIVIEEINNINKCALISVEDKFFISTFSSSHLFN